jgi:hypothetical protein
MDNFSRRWRVRVSLRTAFILFLFVCVAIGVLLHWRNRSLMQRSILGSLNSAYQDNIQIVYDYQVGHDQVRQRLFSGSPNWLARRFGVDFVHSPLEVRFFLPVRTEDLERLARIPSIETMEFHAGFENPSAWEALCKNLNLKTLVLAFDLTPEMMHAIDRGTFQSHFASFSQLKKLTDLHVHFSELLPEDFQQLLMLGSLETMRVTGFQSRFNWGQYHLPTAPQIKSLFFYRSEAGAEALTPFLRTFPNLEFLSIEQARHENSEILDDSIFEGVAELNQLQQLFFHGSSIRGLNLERLQRLPLTRVGPGLSNLSDEGLKQLAESNGLKYLEVGSTRITDEGLQSVAKMSRLEYLSIRDTLTTDAGLMALTGLKNLITIRVRDTRITNEGILEFQRQRPECFVDVK